MKLRLDDYWSMVEQAGEVPEEEACGILIGVWRPGRDPVVGAVLRARNVAEDRTHAFVIDPAALARGAEIAEMGEWEILGSWHSHPSGGLSLSDGDVSGVPVDRWLEVVVARRKIAAYVVLVPKRAFQLPLRIEP